MESWPSRGVQLQSISCPKAADTAQSTKVPSRAVLSSDECCIQDANTDIKWIEG
jgi:hypothetical protein